MTRRYALTASDIKKLIEDAANKPDYTKVYCDAYYKDQDTPLHYPLQSGLPLPKDDDGVVRHAVFINCDFHWNCEPTTSFLTSSSSRGKIVYEHCTFIDCDRPWNISTYKNDKIITIVSKPLFPGEEDIEYV